MLTVWNQRWTEKRGSYRHAAEVIDTRQFSVEPIPGDSTAKAFILEHHYSGSYPTARYRFGLYEADVLVGVAVFSQPINDQSLACLPGAPIENVELGRFVLTDAVPGNGETWFLARAFEHLRREGLNGVISSSDPIPRTRADGLQVFPGHIGTIYQAHNAVYLGKTKRRSLKLMPDGTVLSDRTIHKIRAQERGHKYAEAILEAAGASPLTGDPGEWVNHWILRLTRNLSHSGNHKYAWVLNRKHRKYLPKTLPYPKFATPKREQLTLF